MLPPLSRTMPSLQPATIVNDAQARGSLPDDVEVLVVLWGVHPWRLTEGPEDPGQTSGALGPRNYRGPARTTQHEAELIENRMTLREIAERFAPKS
jgi:hypothetical protein